MDKPSYKLVGGPVGQHGQYTFFKAISVRGGLRDTVHTIGDFFCIRIWQDSELVSIGELQLLWTDRVSGHTLVSLRLYFLPENTPDGRNGHGEHEVVSLNEKVVVRAEDLVTWMCGAHSWRVGLVARPHCAADPTEPLTRSRIQLSDAGDVGKDTDEDDTPSVVVLSYPRYCRYRAVLARLDTDPTCMADDVLAAIGGFTTSNRNTRILYCKDTFEYPELESHEFVCNHLAPRLQGRPRGRRRRHRSTDSDPDHQVAANSSESEGEARVRMEEVRVGSGCSKEEEAFMRRLRMHCAAHGGDYSAAAAVTEVSLAGLWRVVSQLGGYRAVCAGRLWRAVSAALDSRPAPLSARRLYETHLLALERDHSGPLHETILLDSPPPPLHTDTETGETQPAKCLDQKPPEPPHPPHPSPVKREKREDIKISVKPVEQLLDSKIVNELKIEPKLEPKKEPKLEVEIHKTIIEIPKIPREIPKIPREIPKIPREMPKIPREGPKIPWEMPKLPREVTITPWEPPKPAKEPPKPEVAVGINKYSVFNNRSALNSFTELNAALVGEFAQKYGIADPAALDDLAQRLKLVCPAKRETAVTNGHHPRTNEQKNVRSSLRSVRVKPPRTPHRPAPYPVPASTPPKPPPANHDDDVIEVSYKPCSPEVIVVDSYPSGPVPPAPSLPFFAPMGLPPLVVARARSPPPAPPPLPGTSPSIFPRPRALLPVYNDPQEPWTPPPHLLRGGVRAPSRPPQLLDLTTHN